MKKILLLFSVVAMAFNAFAASGYLTVDPLTVRPGKTGNLVIRYHFTLDDNVPLAGYQVDVYVPNDVKINLANSTLGEGYYDDGYALMTNQKPDQDGYGIYGLVGFPMPIDGKMTVIKGTEGILLNVPVTVPASAQSGDVIEGYLRKITFATQKPTQIDLEDVPFTINVDEDVIEAVIDENATVAPAAIENANVKVLRTIKGGEWSTICLPFDMDAAQVKAAFGDDVVIKDFADWEALTLDDDDSYIYRINLSFSPVDAIEAHHPYIIKTSADVSEFVVKDATVTTATDIVTEVKHGRREISSMIGTYVADTTVPDMCLFLSGNNFWYSTGNTKMKGLRAYFDIYDVLTKIEDAGAKIGFVFDGEATGITNIDKQATNDKIYSVGGQYMGTDASRLQRGVYIVNGKKVVKK